MRQKLLFRSPKRSLTMCSMLLLFMLSMVVSYGSSVSMKTANVANVQDQCKAFSGTLEAVESSVTTSGTSANIAAIPNGDINIPNGFTSIFVLTQGQGLVIIDAGSEPSFDVTESGLYTIHTLVYDPNTLDLGIVQLGATTGFDVFGLITEGGGDICASLDVIGAAFKVDFQKCKAFSGSLEAVDSSITTTESSATISAIPNGDIIIPNGYTSIYVLTQGQGLVIIDAGSEPSFDVTETGLYTIHTLVYDPNTLDLGIVQLGVTTGFDVFGLITEGGGDICASLDVTGASFKVDIEECKALAGTLEADASTVCSSGEVTISATPNDDAFIPSGYSVVYVLTQGEGLVIVGAGAEPSFTVNEGGNYTIHTLVYNPDTLDLGIVQLGVTTGFDVYGLITEGGGDICASLDVSGAPITVEDPFAGTLTADEFEVTLENGSATISATPNGDINVPEGYSFIYVLTQGDGLVIVGAGSDSSFEVTEAGYYTIHTLVYDPNTLDLGIVQLGVTTGFDVFGLITEGGGDICASLDVAGAMIKVSDEECKALAGTLEADASTVCSSDEVTISATPNDDAFIPSGYSVVYVLTQGEGLVIVGAGAEPSFTVNEGGNYTIHTLVYNPDTLDLGIVQLGVTTGFDVYGLITEGGGDICASLDVSGAPITVEDPFAGTLTADEFEVTLENGSATISATPNGDINVPEGYSFIYVLTQGDGLVIVGAGSDSSFEVTEAGYYTIHTLVYDPNTLDLGIVQLGVTTGFDVFGLITEGGGDICASLDVAGAMIKVSGESCEAYSGTMHADHPLSCLSYGSATISAQFGDQPVIPEGYENIFVLTNAFGLTILDVSSTPEFTVSSAGLYRIHSLVYNPDTLDLGIVQLGVTTGFDVFGLITEGGGDICASLDVHGPLNLVLPKVFCWFFNFDRVELTTSLESIVDQYPNYEAFEKGEVESKLGLQVYPNPASFEVNVKTNMVDNEVIEYSISDLSGRVIQKGTIRDMNEKIELNSLTSGYYMITFESQFRKLSKHITISK